MAFLRLLKAILKLTINSQNLMMLTNLLHIPFFSIGKSLRVFQKARIKIVARAIYTYLFFSYTYTLLFRWKIKSCCDRWFPMQIRPQTNVQWYILQDYFRVRIGFNVIKKRHILSVAYTILKSAKFQSLLLY